MVLLGFSVHKGTARRVFHGAVILLSSPSVVVIQLLAIFNRGRIGFYSGEPRYLQDDANMLKPTFWTTVPRILLRIYEGVQKKIGNSSFKKWLFKVAMEAKLKDVNK